MVNQREGSLGAGELILVVAGVRRNMVPKGGFEPPRGCPHQTLKAEPYVEEIRTLIDSAYFLLCCFCLFGWF